MKSRRSAIENLKQFFSNTSEDIISVQDAYVAWGRNLENVEGNKAWFSNKLTYMKYHNLVKPVYVVRNNRRNLDKIQLTMEGKKVLGRIEGSSDENISSSTNGNNNSLSIADVMKIVARLRKENPDYEINFDVKLKNI